MVKLTKGVTREEAFFKIVQHLIYAKDEVLCDLLYEFLGKQHEMDFKIIPLRFEVPNAIHDGE